jgi:transposase
MFSLTDSHRYWYYNRPTDMRKSFHTLGGIVTDVMKRDPYSGEVFIFMNKARTRIKLLHWEPGGMVIYSKMLEAGTFGHPTGISDDDSSASIEWRDLVLIVEGMMEDPDGRRQRMDSLRKLRFG